MELSRTTFPMNWLIDWHWTIQGNPYILHNTCGSDSYSLLCSPLEPKVGSGKHKRGADSYEDSKAPPSKKERLISSDGEPLDDYTKLNSKTSQPKKVCNLVYRRHVRSVVYMYAMYHNSRFISCCQGSV